MSQKGKLLIMHIHPPHYINYSHWNIITVALIALRLQLVKLILNTEYTGYLIHNST